MDGPILPAGERERLLARLDARVVGARRLLLQAIGSADAPRPAGVPERTALETLRWFLYGEKGRLLLPIYMACGLITESHAAIVLSPEFAPLFKPEELRRARKELGRVLRPLVREEIRKRVRAQEAVRRKGVGRSRVAPSMVELRASRRRRRGGSR